MYPKGVGPLGTLMCRTALPRRCRRSTTDSGENSQVYRVNRRFLVIGIGIAVIVAIGLGLGLGGGRPSHRASDLGPSHRAASGRTAPA